MEKAIEFMRMYIGKEYEAMTTLHGSGISDKNEFSKKFNEASQLLTPYLGPDVACDLYHDGPKTFVNKGRRRDDSFKVLAARWLFQMKGYKQVNSEIFQAYVGPPYDMPYYLSGPNYCELFYIRLIKEKWQIFSKYRLCRYCGGRPWAIPEEPCVYCHSSGFELWCGKGIPSLKKPVEIRKFIPPSHPFHKAEYDKE